LAELPGAVLTDAVVAVFDLFVAGLAANIRSVVAAGAERIALIPADGRSDHAANGKLVTAVLALALALALIAGGHSSDQKRRKRREAADNSILPCGSGKSIV
jgi:hypothetical protein